MTRKFKAAAATVVVALMPTLSTAMAGEPVPKRKPGLWEITSVAAGTGMTTIKTCIGEDDDIATPEDSGNCSEPKVRREGADLFVDVVCKRAHGKQTLSTAFTGDFENRYHGIMKITFDPPEGVPSMGVILDGKYLGPDCEAAPATGTGK